jgi:hypothetical protein
MDDMTQRMTCIMGRIYMMPRDAQRRIIALDLSHKLITIKSILKTTLDNKELLEQSEAIAELIHKISGFISSIDAKMKQHSDKFLWRWRDPGISADIADIELYTGILMERFDILKTSIELRKMI